MLVQGKKMERKSKNMETSIVKSNVPTPKKPEFSSEKKVSFQPKKYQKKMETVTIVFQS